MAVGMGPGEPRHWRLRASASPGEGSPRTALPSPSWTGFAGLTRELTAVSFTSARKALCCFLCCPQVLGAPGTLNTQFSRLRRRQGKMVL